MTNGGADGTSGGVSGTDGGRLDWRPFAVVAAIAVLVGVINATSRIMEAASDGVALDPRWPWAIEFSSIIFVLALAPFVGWMIGRFPPEPGRWVRFAAAHVVGTAVFSVVHVAGMVGLRKAVFALVGESYDFTGGRSFLMPLLYEWRKDVLTYAAIAAAFWGWRRWGASAAGDIKLQPPSGVDAPAKLEIRDGGRVLFLEPAEILLLEAAGNYVEIHLPGRMHLARGTLAAFEQKLAGQGFVRVHRSRLINRARMTGFSPTPSGDLDITLDDGRTVTGSRRFRSALAAG